MPLLGALKWILPAIYMLGNGTTFFLFWMPWRILTFALPSSIYEFGDECLYSMYQRMVVFFYEHYTNLKVHLYGDTDVLFKRKENVLLICNHQSSVDWIIADILAVRQNSIGYVRYVLKESLKYIPLYGFYFRQHSCIYVNRSGAFEQKKAINQLNGIAKNETPFWMVIYPEGTRYTKSSHEKSKKFAEAQGLPIQQYTLMPRVKGTQLAIQCLGDKFDAVYDVTIAYGSTRVTPQNSHSRNDAPSLSPFLEGKCPDLHLHIERIDSQDIPREEHTIKKWLNERFLHKDQMLQKFFSNDDPLAGSLGEGGKVHKLSLWATLPSALFFGIFGLCFLMTSFGRWTYFYVSSIAVIISMTWVVLCY